MMILFHSGRVPREYLESTKKGGTIKVDISSHTYDMTYDRRKARRCRTKTAAHINDIIPVTYI